jgi:hypothetical protein
MSLVFSKVSLPVLVMSAAIALAWNLDDENPRHPYILLAVSLIAFYLISS